MNRAWPTVVARFALACAGALLVLSLAIKLAQC
jgi:hypothetical protein